MTIYFSRKENKFKDSFFSISKFDKESFIVQTHGPNIPTAERIEGVYPFASYRDSLKTIMRRLFEAQLLRD